MVSGRPAGVCATAFRSSRPIPSQLGLSLQLVRCGGHTAPAGIDLSINPFGFVSSCSWSVNLVSATYMAAASVAFFLFFFLWISS